MARRKAGHSRTKVKGTRRARRVDLGPWLWALALASVAAGLAFSPLTGLRKVVVVGATDEDAAKVAEALQPFAQVPWARFDVIEASDALLVSDAIRSVRLTTNIFGRGEARFVYRRPVARLAGRPEVYLDDRGNLFFWAGRPDVAEDDGSALPVLTVPERFLEFNGLILGVWESVAVVDVVEGLKSRGIQLDYSLAMDEQSVLSLQVADGPEVVFGSSDELPEKLDVLERLVERDSRAFSRARLVNLTAPSRPSISP